MKCNTCANEQYCYDGNHQLTRDGCADNGFAAYVPQTNADRIRGMTDEELAKWLDNLINHCCGGTCVNCFMQEACQTSMMAWLKSPVEVDE